MGVVVMTDKQAVKTIYAAIVRQALDDWKVACRHDDRARKAEIRRFFNSEWGKGILDVLELDFKVINTKFNITQSRVAK